MARCWAFDVDDTMESGGQYRIPSPDGPVKWKDLAALAKGGDVVGLAGNWVGVPALVPNWRDFLSFMVPPNPGNLGKGRALLNVSRVLFPGMDSYTIVGNDPDNLPRYWSQDPGIYISGAEIDLNKADNSPGYRPVGGASGISNDVGAAKKAGWLFIKEDDFAAGSRVGKTPKSSRPYMIYKSFSAPDALKIDEAGLIEAIVSVTGNKDYQGDVIVPGAFKKVLQQKMPKIVFSHDWEQPLGKTIRMEELLPGDARLPKALLAKGYGGLLVTGQLTLGDPKAAAVYEHLKSGSLDEFSIGFDIDIDEKGHKAETYEGDTRLIKSIAPLYEWSPVLFGANPATLPLAVKSASAGEDADSKPGRPSIPPYIPALNRRKSAQAFAEELRKQLG